MCWAKILTPFSLISQILQKLTFSVQEKEENGIGSLTPVLLSFSHNNKNYFLKNDGIIFIIDLFRKYSRQNGVKTVVLFRKKSGKNDRKITKKQSFFMKKERTILIITHLDHYSLFYYSFHIFLMKK